MILPELEDIPREPETVFTDLNDHVHGGNVPLSRKHIHVNKLRDQAGGADLTKKKKTHNIARVCTGHIKYTHEHDVTAPNC